MRKGYTLLAVGLVLLGGPACWAGEIGAAQLPLDATPKTPLVTAPPSEPVVVEGAPAGACSSCAGHQRGERLQRLRDRADHLVNGNGPDPDHHECWQRLHDWLTYCPPKSYCHAGCCSCGGGKCTPCCLPPYMYFLDRCSCTLGYRPLPPHPPVAAPPEDQGPATAPAGPSAPAYQGGPTAGR